MAAENCRTFPSRRPFSFKARQRSLSLGGTTRLMGIVNVTPDSFSDGGNHPGKKEAVSFALRLAEEGADILDIGGESTRPGSRPVSAEEECRRVVPVIEALRRETERLISVDTYKAQVARRALEAGADIVNDISGLGFDGEMGEVVAEFEAGIVLMHCRGEPATMHRLPPSADILGELCQGLAHSIDRACRAGIAHAGMMLDPGIGFGKNLAENLKILNRLELLDEFELPILVGTSRKRFIGDILNLPVDRRVNGTIASSVTAILKGAHVLRVHDVREVREAVEIVDAICSEST